MSTKVVVLSILFLCCLNYLFSQTTTLQVQELSNFAFSYNGGTTWSQPVVNYPYIYCPDRYGFQICQWDSTQETVQRVANFGLNGTASEMVMWNNYLFVAILYDRYTHIQADDVRLYKIDISNPIDPVITDSITTLDADLDYEFLRIVNNTLIATRVQNNIYTGLAVIDPNSMSIVQTFEQYVVFEKIREDYIITRILNAGGFFQIYSVNENHELVNVGEVNLPYPSQMFPKFITVNDSIVISHTDEIATIWHLSNISTWQQISFINDSISSQGVICSGYLIFTSQVNYETFFHIYDISNLEQPELINTCPYPPGLIDSPNIYNMLTSGSHVFHFAGTFGFVCLKLVNNSFDFCFQCYEYNFFVASGRKYGSHILQPIAYAGLACFDISNPMLPTYDFTLFENYTPIIDINGNYMSAWLSAFDGSPSFLGIYEITDIHNPILIFSIPTSPYLQYAFNKSEPQAFYIIDNLNLLIKKYLISNNTAVLQYDYPIPVEMETPVFVHNFLYMVSTSSGPDKNLYVYEGFAPDAPQPPTVLVNYVHDYGWLAYAGEYVFIKSLEEDSPYCTFYNEQSNFQVENGKYGFGFRNYTCVTRESGVSFYNVNESPSGVQEEDFWLPEFSESSYIDWDDSYLYLFSTDHISIYTYTLTANSDPVALNNTLSLSNYPNPFNPSTTISFNVPAQGFLKLDIYNIRGQKVRSLLNEQYAQGQHTISWDGKDDNGKGIASGVYFARINCGGKSDSRKLVLIK